MATFSVIIPVYNGSDTVLRAIASAMGQTYTAAQVIVVDDASTDGTADLVERTYGERVTLIRKLVNQGSAAARNKGMDVATGDYISFLDADDAWHKDKLLLLNTILTSQPNIKLFYHPFSLDPILEKTLPEDITVYKLPFIKLLPGNFITTSCITVKNYPTIRFDDSMRYMEDFDLCLRVGYQHKLYFINIPLTQIYRAHNTPGGISNNKWLMRKGEMKAYRKLSRLSPGFLLLIPFLLTGSMAKHLFKLFK